jgi:hypothetical protein
LALVAFSALSSGTAAAQTTAAQKASAEALFDEGVSLLRAGSLEAACAKLETSQQVDPGVGTLLYLGECYERRGRTASAWASFREAASLAESSNQPDRKKLADSRAARLAPDLAWLRFEIAPETRAIPGLEIRRGSVSVPVELSGNESPVDPGDVVVEARAPGHEPFSATVSVVPKGRAVVTIPWLRALPQAAPSATPGPVSLEPQAAPDKERSPGLAPAKAPIAHRSIVPWVVGGVGVVGIGVGTVFGLRAISKGSDAKDGCSVAGNICVNEASYDAKSSADSAAVISNVAFGIGGAALVTGVILYFALPPTEEPSVGLTPIVDRHNLGLSLTGPLGS